MDDTRIVSSMYIKSPFHMNPYTDKLLGTVPSLYTPNECYNKCYAKQVTEKAKKQPKGPFLFFHFLRVQKC